MRGNGGNHHFDIIVLSVKSRGFRLMMFIQTQYMSLLVPDYNINSIYFRQKSTGPPKENTELKAVKQYSSSGVNYRCTTPRLSSKS